MNMNPHIPTRQRQVLALYCQRIERQDIAAMLRLTKGTVDQYLTRVREELELPDLETVRAWAIQNGYDKVKQEVQV